MWRWWWVCGTIFGRLKLFMVTEILIYHLSIYNNKCEVVCSRTLINFLFGIKKNKFMDKLIYTQRTWIKDRRIDNGRCMRKPDENHAHLACVKQFALENKNQLFIGVQKVGAFDFSVAFARQETLSLYGLLPVLITLGKFNVFLYKLHTCKNNASVDLFRRCDIINYSIIPNLIFLKNRTLVFAILERLHDAN